MLLFVTVIFVIYFFQISARIDNLTKKYNDLLEDSYRDNLRYASQFDHLYTAVRELSNALVFITVVLVHTCIHLLVAATEDLASRQSSIRFV